MFSFIARKLRVLHLLLAMGGFALAGMIAVAVKAVLNSTFRPEITTNDAGVAIIDGPYSYSNHVLDGFAVACVFVAIVLLATSLLWVRLRPTKVY